MSGKNRKGTCPVCSQPRIKKSCYQRGTKEHCKGKNPNPSFIEIEQSSIGFPVYVSNSNHSKWKSQSDRVFGLRKPQTQRKPETVVEQPKNTTSIAARDAAYSQLPKGLSSRHIGELKRRKVTDEQIEFLASLGLATWQTGVKVNANTKGVAGFDPRTGKTIDKSGFVIPTLTLDGLTAGLKIANDNKNIGKYHPISSSDPKKSASWNLPNNESPLAIWNPQIRYGKPIKEIWLVDGELKSGIIYAQLISQGRHDVCVIGAPTANAIVSPLQLKEAIDVLKPERIRLFPDAGDVMNPNVMSAHHKMHKAFCEWGCDKLLSIVWVGQFKKKSEGGKYGDADEWGGIFPPSDLDIDWEEFTSLGLPSSPAFTHWKAQRKFTPDVTLEISDLIEKDGKHFLDFRAPQKGEMLGVKSPTGSGKTEVLNRITGEDAIAISPTINLNQGLAKRLAKGKGEGVNGSIINDVESPDFSFGIWTACPDSTRQIPVSAVKGKPLIIEEALETARAYGFRNTAIKKNRHESIEHLAKLMQAADSVVLCDGGLTDAVVDWYADLAGNKTVTKVLNPHGARMSVNIAIANKAISTNKKGKDAIGAANLFIGSIDKRSRFIMGADSKADAQAFSNYSLDADSCKSEEWAQVAMKNPVGFIEKYKPRNVAYSPVAASGWDLSITGYFEKAYGYFCGVVGTDSILQSLARYRDFSVTREAFIAKKALPDNYGIDTQSGITASVTETLYQYLANLPGLLASNPQALMEANQHLLDQLENDPTQKFIAAEIAAMNFERQHHRACAIWALIDAGHEVDTYQIEKTKELKLDAQAHRLDKTEAKIIKITEAIAADSISDREAEALERQTTWKVGDKARLERHKLLNRLPGIETTASWNDAKSQKEGGTPNNVKFAKALPKLAAKAEAFYLLTHSEILKRRGQNRYQGFLKVGKVDITRLKIQYTRINRLISSGLLELIYPREVGAGANPQNPCMERDSEALEKSDSLYIYENFPLVISFCREASNGRGGESIARGKKTRIEFLRDILEEFGLKLFERSPKSGEYQILNPWVIKGDSNQAILEAVARRFEKPDGELQKANEPFEFEIPQFSRNEPELAKPKPVQTPDRELTTVVATAPIAPAPTPQTEVFKPAVGESVLYRGFVYAVTGCGTNTAFLKSASGIEQMADFHQLERVPQLAMAG